MNTITPEELSLRLATEPSLVLIDVRTPVEFDETHVKQAVNCPLDNWPPRP